MEERRNILLPSQYHLAFAVVSAATLGLYGANFDKSSAANQLSPSTGYSLALDNAASSIVNSYSCAIEQDTSYLRELAILYDFASYLLQETIDVPDGISDIVDKEVWNLLA